MEGTHDWRVVKNVEGGGIALFEDIGIAFAERVNVCTVLDLGLG